jgi:IclR family transcriptional regulator, KDG regulon repressor
MTEKGIQVIDRAFDIIELLSLEKDGLGVTEIGNRIGLHKSTVHRILSAMAERGYIEKVPSTGLYKIGLKLIEISSVYLNNVELKTEARPYLWELTNKLNQPTHLAILDGIEAVYIDKVDVVTSIRLYSQIGRRIPVYCSALGKSLLSGLSDAELDEVISKCSFQKVTSNTILNKEELHRQVRQTRIRGWSLDDEEHDEGIRCIASPIYDYRGKVIAAVSLAGPSTVICNEKDEETGRMVREASLKISKRLGYK